MLASKRGKLVRKRSKMAPNLDLFRMHLYRKPNANTQLDLQSPIVDRAKYVQPLRVWFEPFGLQWGMDLNHLALKSGMDPRDKFFIYLIKFQIYNQIKLTVQSEVGLKQSTRPLKNKPPIITS